MHISIIYSSLKNLRDILLNILFPISCAGCGMDKNPLCIACRAKIPESDMSLDPYIYAALAYRNSVLRTVLWQLKYHGNTILARACAEILYDRILEELAELSELAYFTDPLIIPIPLSKKRLRKRGFNQTEIIVRALSVIDTKTSFTPAYNVLYKITDTKSQMSIKDKRERRKNIVGCFAVKNREQIRNKNIILIDDITTTGATFHEARKTLLNAGAKQVVCFAVAH